MSPMSEMFQGTDVPQAGLSKDRVQTTLSIEQIISNELQSTKYESDRVEVVSEWVERRASVTIIANPNGHGVASAEATRKYLSQHGVSCKVIVGSPVVTTEPISTYPKTFWTTTLPAMIPSLEKTDAVLFLGIPLDIHNRDTAEASIVQLSQKLGEGNRLTPHNRIVFLDFHPNDFRLCDYVRSLNVSGYDRCALAPAGDPLVLLAGASMQNSPERSGDELHRLAEILDWAVRPLGRRPQNEDAAAKWEREAQQRIIDTQNGLATQGLAYLETLGTAFKPYYLTARVYARLGRAGIVDSNDLKGSHSVYKTLGAIAVQHNLSYCFALRTIKLDQSFGSHEIEVTAVTNPGGQDTPIAKVMEKVLGAGAWEHCRCKGTEEAFSARLPPRQAAFLFCKLLEAVSGEEVIPLDQIDALAIVGPPNSGKSVLSFHLAELLEMFGVSVEITDLDTFAPTLPSYLTALRNVVELQERAKHENIPEGVLEDAEAALRKEEGLRKSLKSLDSRALAACLAEQITAGPSLSARCIRFFDLPAGKPHEDGLKYLDSHNQRMLTAIRNAHPQMGLIHLSAVPEELSRLNQQFMQEQDTRLSSIPVIARFVSLLSSSYQLVSSDDQVQIISSLDRKRGELLQNPALVFLAARLAQGLEERRAELILKRIQDEAKRLEGKFADHKISVEVGGPLVAGLYSLYGLVPNKASGTVEADLNVCVSSSLSDEKYAELSSQIARALGISPNLLFETRPDRAHGNDGYWEGTGTIFDDTLEAQLEISLRVRRGDDYRSVYKLAQEVLSPDVLASAKLWYEQFLRYGNVDAARALKVGLRAMIIDQAIAQGRLEPQEPAPLRSDNPSINESLDQALANVRTLSRTTKGEGNTEAHADKPALLLSGDDLQRRAEANYNELLYEIFERPAKISSPDDVKALFNRLYVKVNTGLFSTAGSQWRTWPTVYNPVHPDHIRGELDRFYLEFFVLWSEIHEQSTLLSASERLNLVASLAAFMEYEWNHRIHPVRDGVCRTSCAVTALIFSSFGLPQTRLQISFDDKDSRKRYYAAFDAAEAVTQQALREGKSRHEARWEGIKHFATWYRNNLVEEIEEH